VRIVDHLAFSHLAHLPPGRS